MDAASALADLTEVSSQVEEAAIFEEGGRLLAATPGGARLEGPGRELLQEAARVGGGAREPARIEVRLRGGAVLVLREHGRAVVARTLPRPPSALLFHDLGACLRALEEPSRA